MKKTNKKKADIKKVNPYSWNKDLWKKISDEIDNKNITEKIDNKNIDNSNLEKKDKSKEGNNCDGYDEGKNINDKDKNY